jgi:hypothetical protein
MICDAKPAESASAIDEFKRIFHDISADIALFLLLI